MSIAPQSNPPITPQYFQPSNFTISDIIKGRTTIVIMNPSDVGGTTVNPNYVVGQTVRLIVPNFYGMSQINNMQGYVISIPSSDSVEVDIDSRFFNSFISSPTYSITPAQIIAIGDVNTGQVNSSGRINNITYIDGSFINISPN